MPKPSSFEEPELNLVATLEEPAGEPDPETPFRIALLGDWSGRANRGHLASSSELASYRPLLVDRDNFDRVLAKLGVRLHLPVADDGSLSLTLRFDELDDFHPDRIFERIEVFSALRRTRERLKHPATYLSAADEVRSWAKTEASASDEAARKPHQQAPDAAEPVAGGLLERMLEEAPTSAPETSATQIPEDLDSLLREIVKPHLVPGSDPKQAELLAAVDQATGRQMRMIMHHPDFQAIEAAWRSVYFLADRLETSTSLKLYLLDISKAELAADLASMNDIHSTGIYKLFAEQTAGTHGAEPWAVLAGNYLFDHTREDVEMLARLAQVAKRAGATFISAASPHFLNCESLAETPDPEDWRRPSDPEVVRAWESFRKLPAAAYVGLALPRFLLRLPYGADTEPTEQFDFEEMAGGSTHESYLWGNPAFACAYLIARAFSEYGWELRPGVFQEIEGLPLHVYEEEGEAQIKPCAEVLLTMRSAEAMLERGLMPLLSFREADRVRLARFQSVADPATPLAGRWS